MDSAPWAEGRLVGASRQAGADRPAGVGGASSLEYKKTAVPARMTAVKGILDRLAMRLGMLMTSGAAAVQQGGASSVYRLRGDAFKARGCACLPIR